MSEFFDLTKLEKLDPEPIFEKGDTVGYVYQNTITGCKVKQVIDAEYLLLQYSNLAPFRAHVERCFLIAEAMEEPDTDLNS